MLAYVMVGTSDLEQSIRFYDAVLAPLGLTRTENESDYVGYAPVAAPRSIEFYVTVPFNREPATFGNGTMISLAADTPAALDEFHSAALANGGTDEGRPGPRPEGADVHYAYVRDPDGNKICACHTMPAQD